ncbi:MAG TPA: hypothetical protein VF092_15195 [Longimicrobium sp.]
MSNYPPPPPNTPPPGGNYPPPPPPPPFGGGGGTPPPPPPPPGGGGGGYTGGTWPGGPGPGSPGSGGPGAGGPGPGGYTGGPYTGGPPPPGGGPERPYGGGYAGGPPQPPAKSNKMPIILGCGGCGLLVVLALVAFFLIGALGKKRGGSSGGDTTSVSAADMEGTAQFASSPDGLNDTLSPHYLPFSFRYPDDWRVVESGTDPGDRNFVKVEKQENDVTQENFAVGYMYAPAGRENDPEVLRQLTTQFEQQFASQFPNFRRVSDDRVTIGGHEATGFRFTARQNNVDIFGRFLVLPVGEGKGLSIIMLGTPVGSGLSSVEDLGEKGGLPVILRTFRVGDEAARATADQTSSETPASDTTPSSGTSDSDEGKPSDKPSSDDQTPPSGEDTLPEIRRIEPINR